MEFAETVPYGEVTEKPEEIVEINGEGEILWGKTIDESFALIEDNRPYYMELHTGKTVDDDMDYFKRLQECILTECSQQLHDAQLDTLIPDIISIPKFDGVDYFIIFDAKYYNIQLEKGKSLRGNPGVGDVTKQYLYQLAYREFIKAHNIAVVKNCFLMPTEKDEIVKKGTAKMPMLAALGLENIQIRQIPAKMLYECYLTQRKIDINLLEL